MSDTSAQATETPSPHPAQHAEQNQNAQQVQNAQPSDDGANRHTPLLFLLLVATALGAGVLWLRAQSNPPPASQTLPPELRDEPDLYVNDAIIHQFHQDGSRKYLLQAATVSHFDGQQITRMTAPDLLLDPTTARIEPWHATAEFGHVSKRAGPQGRLEEVVFLRNDVKLAQNRAPPGFLLIQSAQMYLYPDREYVETNESVTIATHTGRTVAGGLHGNLATGELRLIRAEQQVQTIVLPSQFK